MSPKTKYHLLISISLFVILSVFLVIFKYNNIKLIALFLGISVGTFLLDLDHLIFWLFLKPNIEESHLAKTALKNKDIKSVLRLIKLTHQSHYNLIFHHYFFQVILVFFSLFILTSSNNVFVSSLIISLNLHLLVDEINDYKKDPKKLQKWLFARESKQLPVKFLKQYIIIFTILFIFLVFLFTQSLL